MSISHRFARNLLMLIAATTSAASAWAGPPGLIDNFNDADLSQYTKSVVLEQDAVSNVSISSPAGVLQVTKGNPGANAEQVAFLRSDFTLAVGETLRIDSAAADVATPANPYADFGIMVATTVDPADAVWTTGTADVRRGILAIYGKPAFNTVGYLGRNNNATPGADIGSSAGVSVTGAANPTDADWTALYRGLWIKRVASLNFTGGWVSAASGDVQLVSWTVTDPLFGSAVGIWADLRAEHTYGDLDNFRIVAAPTLGDVNGDGVADINDFNTISDNFLRTPATRLQGDLNGDNVVNFADFREWKLNKSSPPGEVLIPEPSTLALAALGCLAAARRRRSA